VILDLSLSSDDKSKIIDNLGRDKV
jgi:hypothetical protein